MIIGVDGNVATGKTTLVRALAARMDARALDEYPPHPAERPGGRPGAGDGDPLAVQRHYLDAEAHRFRAVMGDRGRNGATGRPARADASGLSSLPGRLLLLDRSIVSQVGHAVAVGAPGRAVRALLGLRLAEAAGPVLLPDLLVLLIAVDGDDLHRRLARRESGAGAMGTAPGYVEPAYLAGYNEYLRRLASSLKEPGVVAVGACPDATAVHEHLAGMRETIRPERLRTALLKELGE